MTIHHMSSKSEILFLEQYIISKLYWSSKSFLVRDILFPMSYNYKLTQFSWDLECDRKNRNQLIMRLWQYFLDSQANNFLQKSCNEGIITKPFPSDMWPLLIFSKSNLIFWFISWKTMAIKRNGVLFLFFFCEKTRLNKVSFKNLFSFFQWFINRAASHLVSRKELRKTD